MKTPKERANELVRYFFEGIGINYSGYTDTSVDFAIYYCKGIIKTSDNISIIEFYNEVLKELKANNYENMQL